MTVRSKDTRAAPPASTVFRNRSSAERTLARIPAIGASRSNPSAPLDRLAERANADHRRRGGTPPPSRPRRGGVAEHPAAANRQDNGADMLRETRETAPARNGACARTRARRSLRGCHASIPTPLGTAVSGDLDSREPSNDLMKSTRQRNARTTVVGDAAFRAAGCLLRRDFPERQAHLAARARVLGRRLATFFASRRCRSREASRRGDVEAATVRAIHDAAQDETRDVRE